MIPLMLPSGERLDQARNANTLLTTLNHETEVSGFSSDLFFVASSSSLSFSLASYFFPHLGLFKLFGTAPAIPYPDELSVLFGRGQIFSR